ncbi:hypothetical protein IVB02_06370 [Bradyrhizobium sp. 166]|uniref:hypothetical protein n=1 Tax=Bradyrhizobium sp. 166 TaxID=2782638 RepID=UPI001FFBD377|nr:hypothetical protein [Bradyrhizobium sp. 166]MCK1601055.1 hypothetical protein [Bradyrhizobium sp. 166]
MTDIEDAFSSFLAEWSKTNLASLGDRTDPSDQRYYHALRANRLRKDAETAGFSIQVHRLRLNHKGGLPEFIQGAYEQEELRRKHGDDV